MSNKSRRPADRPSGTKRPQQARGQAAPAPRTGWRARLERFSAPILVTMHSLPRLLVPITLAVFLFLGLLLSGQWAWLGGVLLALVTVFVLWLTALSWPVLTGSSRLVRVVIVISLAGVTVLKFLDRM